VDDQLRADLQEGIDAMFVVVDRLWAAYDGDAEQVGDTLAVIIEKNTPGEDLAAFCAIFVLKARGYL
jgi:hypothetical protein